MRVICLAWRLSCSLFQHRLECVINVFVSVFALGDFNILSCEMDLIARRVRRRLHGRRVACPQWTYLEGFRAVGRKEWKVLRRRRSERRRNRSESQRNERCSKALAWLLEYQRKQAEDWVSDGFV